MQVLDTASMSVHDTGTGIETNHSGKKYVLYVYVQYCTIP